jgi:small subunit ribosomal protein S11e
MSVRNADLQAMAQTLTQALLADKKCPFTGMVSIRGRILTGTVVSTKMHRTLIVRREYLHFIPKYARYEKRHANLAAHVSPAFRVEEGDTVTVGQCRPLSKTVSYDWGALLRKWSNTSRANPLNISSQVRFNVLRVLPRTGQRLKQFNKF